MSVITARVKATCLRRLGETIRDTRIVSGMTQVQLANRAGTSRQTINAIERGTNEPGMVLFVHIAQALDVLPHELMKAVNP